MPVSIKKTFKMETAFSLSSKLVVNSANVVKFFVPRFMYDPRVVIFKSARIARYFVPNRIVNLGERCVEYIGVLSSILTLLEQVRELEQQIRAVKESVVQKDEKYTKAKLDNVDLNEQIMSLKRQIEDMELKNEERSQEENERLRDLMEQIQREQVLISEYVTNKVSSFEGNNENFEMMINELAAGQKRLMKGVEDLTQDILSAKKAACSLKQQEKRVKEDNNAKAKIIDELIHEMEIMKSQMRKYLSDTTSEESPKLRELYKELCRLKEKNFLLEEANNDLKSSLLTAGLEHGQLLTYMRRVTADLNSMTKEEIHKALKEEQDCNSKLLIYIDKILSKIVETYPQLLEAQQRTKSSC